MNEVQVSSARSSVPEPWKAKEITGSLQICRSRRACSTMDVVSLMTSLAGSTRQDATRDSLAASAVRDCSELNNRLQGAALCDTTNIGVRRQVDAACVEPFAAEKGKCSCRGGASPARVIILASGIRRQIRGLDTARLIGRSDRTFKMLVRSGNAVLSRVVQNQSTTFSGKMCTRGTTLIFAQCFHEEIELETPT